MLSDFIIKKMGEANYKLLEDGQYFGEIPGVKGVWADAKSLDECRAELQAVLESWLMMKLRTGDRIPGLKTETQGRVLLKHA